MAHKSLPHTMAMAPSSRQSGRTEAPPGGPSRQGCLLSVSRCSLLSHMFQRLLAFPKLTVQPTPAPAGQCGCLPAPQRHVPSHKFVQTAPHWPAGAKSESPSLPCQLMHKRHNIIFLSTSMFEVASSKIYTGCRAKAHAPTSGAGAARRKRWPPSATGVSSPFFFRRKPASFTFSSAAQSTSHLPHPAKPAANCCALCP